MAKTQTRHICQKCGHEASRWLGRCPDCGAWNSLLEEVVVERPAAAARTSTWNGSAAAPQPISSVPMEAWRRIPSGIGEFDRVLGGGIVPGSLVLIGGDPGIGKSTLLMQVAGQVAQQGDLMLYVTGEESAQQVRLRAERLDTLVPQLYLAAETDIDVIEAHARNLKPRFLVIDSIQTVLDPALASAAATVSQVRACCSRLMRLAKATNTTVFLVGHVTKEGTLAGPRVLEHMVDTVLYFEGDRFQSFRILRAVKNRFGSTDEIGLFEMSDLGLREVAGASELFLSQRPEHVPGSAVVGIIEGTRPLLVEVQALVARSYLSAPRRTATGIDPNRLSMILAVLEKRCGLRMSDKDVYVNVAGGLKIVEPAVDLGVALALASSHRDRPVDQAAVLTGEIGLSGEVRSVHQMDRRLKEAARMGFSRALVAGPGSSRGAPEGLAVTAVSHLRDAIHEGLVDGVASERDSPLEDDLFTDPDEGD